MKLKLKDLENINAMGLEVRDLLYNEYTPFYGLPRFIQLVKTSNPSYAWDITFDLFECKEYEVIMNTKLGKLLYD